jgi:hypothetical protein
MSQDDERYYHRRAEEEIERAIHSTDQRAVAFHYTLANLYLDRVFGADEGQAQASQG